MKPFDLHLLRHAPPLRTGLMLGHHDEPVAPGAHRELIDRASSLGAEEIVTSDLTRAQDGARLISDACALPLRVDRRWRELGFGKWDSKPSAAVDPQHLQAFWSDPDANPPPDGERWSEFRNRIRDAIAELDRTAIVVSHAGAMRAAVSVLTGLDHRAVWAFDLSYGALLSIRVWRGEGSEPASGQIVGLRT
ncbi:histidine phosphatase family protein [Alteriqipengyuania lutimaris]|uniref:Histidine phosphatase family protein n=1 Tax=Alteriqipengyuania lutimaris TaxID=1538146 RepID=A0A395LK53_9SPHN|nr:histidine phosphatase family protein [Alteriqipengyuania lutimaris]MBB3033617.1 alpha-ribazole phosphatase [Alteriqipengyuania lutimaris]RDS77386.1 histidine phosphatase family protein [Alteriqipengyuania lutimaris]